MKMYVQWASDPAGNWQQLDSANWEASPKKSAPPEDRAPVFADPGDIQSDVVGFTGTAITVDNTPGWIYALNVFGVIFHADHIAVSHIAANHIRVASWNDDLDDPGTNFLNGQIRDFRQQMVDNEFVVPGGSIRARGFHQEKRRFVPADKIAELKEEYTTTGLSTKEDYVSFSKPPAQFVRHGIWQLTSQIDALKTFQPPDVSNWSV